MQNQAYGLKKRAWAITSPMRNSLFIFCNSTGTASHLVLYDSCETEIQEGRFGLTVDPRQKNMIFGRDGLIAMVEVKNAEEYELRVIRVNYGPSSAK